jgi:hypothetical protein
MTSIPLDHLDRSAYPAWLPGKIKAMLARAQRVQRYCLLCGHPAKLWHVWMPPSMSTLAADSTQLRPYATCKGCGDRDITLIEKALGIAPAHKETSHASN